MKNNIGLVSVLLSIYKVDEYLAECLDSLLVQSYKNMEFICVDNGSPDKCGKILKEYAKKDKRIKIITLPENKMLCGGRNAGLDNATGEFITFFDPDDWAEVDYIKSMVDTINEKYDPDGNPYNLIVNTCARNYMVENNQLKILHFFDRPTGNYNYSDYNDNVAIDSDIPMWGRLYRKSFLDKYNIRFIDGVNTDNLPYTFKLMGHLKNWYLISNNANKNANYWRRMITVNGAITDIVLYKNLEIPYCLNNLYDYFIENKMTSKIKVPFHIFFSVCFSKHIDKPRYYEAYKQLMLKMEYDIKNNPSVYNKDDVALCDLLIYSNGYFDFCKIYFIPNHNINYSIKLFNFITLYKQKGIIGKKMKYFLLGIPLLKIKQKNGINRCYLFGFLPIIKIINKE